MHIKTFKEYEEAYKSSVTDPEGFWADIAGNFKWQKKWDKVLDWNFEEPNIKWFVNGKLNITENCIDMHLPQK
ncbi:MAG: acetyl-coenzyme A synthetase N-terminal domain-containing protein, partial [Bacteroidia bacterium]